MIREAASVKFADTVHSEIPMLQIVAIEEWFKGVLAPYACPAGKRATRHE
jgi:hypothetical protein